MQLTFEKQVSSVFIAFGTLLYIILGIIVFIFIPAIVFCNLERWTYMESVYFGFITFTTIGFGDFVPGIYITQALTLKNPQLINNKQFLFLNVDKCKILVKNKTV